MDIALWKTAVGAYKSSKWKQYQNYAHMFVHSDFIQSHCTPLSAEEISAIRAKHPHTFLVHRGKGSAGEVYARSLHKKHKRQMKRNGKIK